MVTSEFVTYIYKLAHPIVNTIEEIYIYSLQAIRAEVLIITCWLHLPTNNDPFYDCSGSPRQKLYS